MDETRVILDTDIGTDVDDCLALGLILASPEVKLEGVTCVYGDVERRARMVGKLLRLRGRPEVAVARGARQPLLGRRAVYWAGHEGDGLLDPDDPLPPCTEHAVDLIIRTAAAHPGQLQVIAIGPLTNLALAFLREPGLAQSLAGLTIMGGVARGPGRWDLPYVEHNLKCDPEAARVVFTAGAPITLVPLDVTTQVRVRPGAVERIRAGGTPYHRALADQIDLYPPFRSRGWTHLHDPLAVAALLAPDLVDCESLHVEVELDGEHTAGATLLRAPSETAAANARVALGVRAAEFEEFLIERLAR